MQRAIIVASGNTGKIKEIKRQLSDIGIAVSGLPGKDIPEPEEPHDNFRDNALEKARYYCAELNSPVLADDSGIEVDWILMMALVI